MGLEDNTSRAATVPPDPHAGAEPPVRFGWRDFAVPAGIFLFCGIIVYISTTFEEALPIIVGDSMQPRVFPIFLMVLIALLNLGLIGQILSRPAARLKREPGKTWATVVLLGVFYFLTEYVDMMAALVVVMFTMCMVWGERRWWAAGLVAFGTTAVIFFSFDLILEVRFPRGLFTNWYYG